jgi:hypothetical protein
MLLFANVMAQASVIFLCKGSSWMPGPHGKDRTVDSRLQEQAFAAAEGIIELSSSLVGLHYVKVTAYDPTR